MQKNSLKSYNFKMFLFAFLSNIRVYLVGSLPLSEILALFDLRLYRKFKQFLRSYPDLKWILGCYLLFFFAQLLSDLVNGSSFRDSSRGLANIVMAGIVLFFVFKNLAFNRLTLIYFLVGYSISRFIFGGSVDEMLNLGEESGFFKFGVAPITNNIVLLLSYYLLKYLKLDIYIVLLFGLYGLLSLGLDYRSNGIMFIMASIIFFFRDIISRVPIFVHFLLLIVAFFLFYFLYALYVDKVLAGEIGGNHSMDQLRQMENPYNPFELLETGRGVTFVAMEAIKESPLFGHGSWAPDPTGKYNMMLFERQGIMHRYDTYLNNRNGLLIIPSHSIILGAWMNSGILGFISMISVLFFFLNRSYRILINKNSNKLLLPIIIYFSLIMSWNFFFSPLPHLRQSVPIMLALIIVTYNDIVNK